MDGWKAAPPVRRSVLEAASPLLIRPFAAAAAQLPAPQMIAIGRVEGGPESAVYDYVADTLRSLLPMAEATGVTTAAAADIATLAPRLRQEAVESNACIMLPPLVGAWTWRPG